MATSVNSTNTVTPPFVDKQTANTMIGSYLTSIGAPTNTTNLRSLIIDADALRGYLTDSEEGKSITRVKLMFAHTEQYINSGHGGENCGYQSGALTIIIAGFDNNGNYILNGGGGVMNHANPCPHYCPSVGTAASDLLPQS